MNKLYDALKEIRDFKYNPGLTSTMIANHFQNIAKAALASHKEDKGEEDENWWTSHHKNATEQLIELQKHQISLLEKEIAELKSQPTTSEQSQQGEDKFLKYLIDHRDKARNSSKDLEDQHEKLISTVLGNEYTVIISRYNRIKSEQSSTFQGGEGRQGEEVMTGYEARKKIKALSDLSPKEQEAAIKIIKVLDSVDPKERAGILQKAFEQSQFIQKEPDNK